MFIAVETVVAASVRISVSFGKDANGKCNNAEEIFAKETVEILNQDSKESKKQNVLDTVARNAIEHQKRVKLRVEQMISSKTDANSFVNEAREK
jgi:hypothetical protein